MQEKKKILFPVKKVSLRVSCIAGSPLGRGRRRSRRPSPPSCDRPVEINSNFKSYYLNTLGKQSHVAGRPGPAAPVALPGGRVEGSGGRANYCLVVRPKFGEFHGVFYFEIGDLSLVLPGHRVGVCAV